MLPRPQLPPSPRMLALIALAFVAPGLIGHDPWKAVDAIGIEVVHEMHRLGDWLVPRVGGAPHFDDPPLYHWVALAFAKLFGSLLQFHDAARLASGLFVLAALHFLHAAARMGERPGAENKEEIRLEAPAAVLMLVGAVGLIVHAHEAIPDLAALAASAASFAMLARATQKPVAAGTGFGIALGVAFLATGPLVPAALLVAALLAWVVCDEFRHRRYATFIVIAVPVGILLAASWPIALALRSPALAEQWWGVAQPVPADFGRNLRYFLEIGTWFTWPAWPLAVWALWARRREWRSSALFVPLAASLTAFLAICLVAAPQDVNMLPMLPPLALLAARGIPTLRRSAANALDWFGVMTFGFFASLIWLGYIAMMTGVPPRIARNFLKTAPGFVPQFEWLPLLVALALTFAWLWFVLRAPPSPTRGVLRWAAGVALLWGTFATLWLAWADYQKSYRFVALQLKAQIPVGTQCLGGHNLGAPQRAALSYHAGIRTVPMTPAMTLAPAPTCGLLLVQGSPRNELGAPGSRWTKIADVGRPGDKSERYRIYRFNG